jgi:hypothetical protein
MQTACEGRQTGRQQGLIGFKSSKGGAACMACSNKGNESRNSQRQPVMLCKAQAVRQQHAKSLKAEVWLQALQQLTLT